MERLTKWNESSHKHAYYPRCFEEPCYGSGCKIKDCPFETAVCERLAAFEDIAELCGEADRLRELAEADKDGRVVILPCKVGDTVYRLQYIEQTLGRFTVGAVPIKFALIWLEEFGKTVFLTREEAEKALAEMKGDAEK